MPITLDFESLEGIAVGVGRGELSIAEIRAAAAHYWKLVKSERPRIVWDMREASFDLDEPTVAGLAEFAKEIAADRSVRVAFVLSGDREFGLVRMFEAHRETAASRTRVFRDYDQALEWLRGEEDG